MYIHTHTTLGSVQGRAVTGSRLIDDVALALAGSSNLHCQGHDLAENSPVQLRPAPKRYFAFMVVAVASCSCSHNGAGA